MKNIITTFNKINIFSEIFEDLTEIEGKDLQNEKEEQFEQISIFKIPKYIEKVFIF
jgi:hypothetical protein